MSKQLILIDTNVIVYAINSSSPKHIQAQSFLQSKIGSLAITHQNVLEAFRVLTHSQFTSPMNYNDAVDAIHAITQNARLLIPNMTTYHLTMEFINKYGIKGDKVFDAYLASTALSNDVMTIATYNTIDFREIIEIKTYNPFKI